ncbi:serine O-acetyltransferase [Mycolicibacterium fluoranthenivorans]|uniref:Serine acetyltransferase n=1 Tax=Mycolicibacterium fluoranthenivorans TaxID=258505 RepID=A0A7X5ZAJ6_9MYCO|nr:hypothetical protein [Mycolicibacterium fluoranthenivorans]MCV7359274.1 hypothetical protein [Mycolicibacterium fluoranthenivorans]NIH93642.1 serine O-acetyltransferase [Mycolicibacterium fluoranthenivorans]
MKSKFDAIQHVVAELRESGDEAVSDVGVLLRALLTRPRRRLVLWIRLQEWLDATGKHSLARLVSARIYSRYGCMISPTARIGREIAFPHPVGIVIGDGAVVGDNCTIYQNVTLGRQSLGPGGYPTLGSRVVIFAGSQILGEIELADGVTVGALTLVTKSCLTPGSTLVGIPARALVAKKTEA